jgi:hypothetical protein
MNDRHTDWGIYIFLLFLLAAILFSAIKILAY